MNVENINERLLRTERERDEARAELAHLRAVIDATAKEWLKIDSIPFEGAIDGAMRAAVGEIARLRAVQAQAVKVDAELWAQVRPYLAAADLGRTWASIIKRLAEAEKAAVTERDAVRAEIARLRAAQNERAIVELQWVANMMRGGVFDHAWTQARVDIANRLIALRAETPAAPQPAPSGGVERAIAELEAQLRGINEAATSWARTRDSATDKHEADRLDSRVKQLTGVAFHMKRRIAEIRAEQQAAPVPPASEVFRDAAKNCTGEMFGEAAAVKPPVTPKMVRFADLADGQEFLFTSDDGSMSRMRLIKRDGHYGIACVGSYYMGDDDMCEPVTPPDSDDAWLRAPLTDEEIKAVENATGSKVTPADESWETKAIIDSTVTGWLCDDSRRVLVDYINRKIEAAKATPPADAPSRPSVASLEAMREGIHEAWKRDENGSSAVDLLQRAVRLALDELIAARGGAK